jgi:hypothetical protein
VPSHKESKSIYWLCKCDCGKSIEVRGSSLISGHTKSCGCYLSDKLTEKNTKHGGFGTRLYSIWQGMKKRCYVISDKDYHNYGGRGIKICDKWLNDFEAFQKWSLNHGYSNELTIDRINVNGNYEPCNCRWADLLEQNNNKRSNKLLTVANKTMTLSMWARERDLKPKTVIGRLKLGWSVVEALNFAKREES